MVGSLLPRISGAPLRRQVALLLIVTGALFAYLAGEAMRVYEQRYLQKNIERQSSQIISLLGAASLDALVSEDGPVLKTTVDQLVESDPDIVELTIQNEDGVVLASWDRKEKTPQKAISSYNELITASGETFGMAHISWDISAKLAEVSTHVLLMRSMISFILLVFSGAILVWLELLVLKPLRMIYGRLEQGSDQLAQQALPKIASQEILRLDQSIDERLSAEKAKIEAEIASKTKGRFLANMSHEIRTPMNGIICTADLLAETSLNGDQREYLGMVRSSAETLLTIINDILDLSKIEAGKLEIVPREFNLPEMMTRVVGMMSTLSSKKGLELSYHYDPQIPSTVVGDSVRLQQVIINMLSNAIKFTNKGEVSLRLELLQTQGQDLLLRCAVKDSGIGIAKENHHRIFQAFSQADNTTTRNFGGTGLGLNLSRQLVQMMGGDMRFESELGSGSTFFATFILKGFATEVVSDKEARPEFSPAVSPIPNPTPAPAPQQNALRILVAEDNNINQRIIKATLEKLGHAVIIAGDGEMAIAELEKRDFDIVFMDVQMPKMDGMDATQRIRMSEKQYAKVPIVALTAHAFEEDRERCIKAGMDDYLTKPIERKRLLSILDSFTKPR